ncbi:MAG: phosphohistidine phosphatase SixA [Mucilaginibacter sp.]|nr:phosphohistidine phosphatase SixA [Mucilaginibacter sp.]
MKRRVYYCLILLTIFTACKKNNPNPVTISPKVTSAEYIDNLLIVPSNSYQIRTSDSATFSSADPNITVSNSGFITNLTSGEIVKITITWKNGTMAPSTIYALGATDIDQLEPAAYFHGETATDPYNNYVQGWKLLQKLPISNETYTLVLRHADASFGRDWPLIHTDPAPANWWMSQDSLLARQLNKQGIARATELGQIFKDLNYPIKRVFASEFYRARQTAALMNMGPQIQIDSRVNHITHNTYGPGLLNGVLAITQEQPVDNQMTMIVTHHPANEPPNTVGIYITFPAVSAFNWSGSYFIKYDKDGSLTFQGAVTYAMFKYWRDMKLNKL